MLRHIGLEMDTLKSFEEILEPDSRQKAFALINRETGVIRERTLQDHYSAVEEIKLSEPVPGMIREHFETARNLLLYSWFEYRFMQVAELHAFASVEFALQDNIPEKIRNEKICKKCGAKKIGLKYYLDIAIKEGWIKDSGFRNYRRAEKERSGQEVPDDHDKQDIQRYCKVLAESIPYLRNKLAHGSDMLHPSGFTTLAICADLINQLYETEDGI